MWHKLKIPLLAVAASPAVVAPSDQLLKSEQLDALVAPIALYPDSLLALVFMASTYPLEVVQADRWLKDNKNLKGDQLKAAVDKQSWDDSVKSLVASPDVLSMLSSKLSWTVKLGDAVLAQQPDLMDAVQRLRTRAEANNKLTSNTQQKVTKSLGPGAGKPSLSSRLIPTCSMCRITIQLSFMVAGPMRIIRPTFSGIPPTSAQGSSRLGSRSAPVGRLGDGVREGTTGVAALTGTSTTSTSTAPE